jgi:alcohol dehydrogenase
LAGNYERVLRDPDDLEARGSMQLGAYFAGVAIEHSMLGAAHACANPLTARYSITHGQAIAALLPHVVRFNRPASTALYRELYEGDLGDRLARMAELAGLPVSLHAQGISKESLPALAQEAAAQWTGRFNPRPFDCAGALEIYECAY